MKPLSNYDTAAKAMLLWDLFPEEIPALLQYFRQVCLTIRETKYPDTLLNGYSDLLPVSFLLLLCVEMDRLISGEEEKLLTDKYFFAAGLFSSELEPLTIYCLKIYIETRVHPNGQFSHFINLLFLSNNPSKK